MSYNIKHERSTVTGKLGAINSKINKFEANTGGNYGTLRAGISKSQSDHITALQNQLEQEEKAAKEIVIFFRRMTSMMEKASEALEQIETTYRTKKVNENTALKGENQ